MKTVFISGGTRGIGRASAEIFLKKGYRVAVSYEKSDDIAYEMQKKYPNDFMAIKCNAGSVCEVNAAIAKATDSFGTIDILVNNVGISSQKMLCDTGEDEWDRMFAINVKSAYSACRAVYGDMVRKKYGRIINISSIWGMVGASCEVCYSATKAAIIGFTKALAKELGPSGITVNCIAPGVIDTDMNKGYDAQTISELCSETPIGRIGTAEEIAKTIAYLASDDADFITGQVISPNGGFVI